MSGRRVFVRSQQLYELFLAYRERFHDEGVDAEPPDSPSETPVWFDVVPPDEAPTPDAS
jgi:hypothetical protein